MWNKTINKGQIINDPHLVHVYQLTGIDRIIPIIDEQTLLFYKEGRKVFKTTMRDFEKILTGYKMIFFLTYFGEEKASISHKDGSVDRFHKKIKELFNL